jgi:hypothetical protein
MAGQIASSTPTRRTLVELDEPQTYHFGGHDLLTAFAFPQIEVAAVTGDTGNCSRSTVRPSTTTRA